MEQLLGLIDDPRSELEKAKDYQFEEIYSFGKLNWDKTIDSCPVYSVRDQDGSSSCVAQSAAKALEVILGQVMSAHPIYRRRSNFPNQGMWLQDCGEIIRKLGTTTENLDPSQKLSEAEMNKDVLVDTPILGFNYAFCSDIDQIAQAIESYKQCFVTIGFNYDEYVNAEKPVSNGLKPNAYHCLCAIYYFTDENGEKCIVAEESWGVSHTRRIFTESYLNARKTGAMYFIPKPAPIDKPKFTFQNPMSFGQSNYSIKMLQDILRYEGLFSVKSSGFFGTITANALFKWQVKHQVASPEELNSLKGQRAGVKTIAKLNEIYG